MAPTRLHSFVLSASLALAFGCDLFACGGGLPTSSARQGPTDPTDVIADVSGYLSKYADCCVDDSDSCEATSGDRGEACRMASTAFPYEDPRRFYFVKHGCLVQRNAAACTGYLLWAQKGCPNAVCMAHAVSAGDALCRDDQLDYKGRDFRARYCELAGKLNASGTKPQKDLALAQFQRSCQMGSSGGCYEYQQISGRELSQREIDASEAAGKYTGGSNGDATREFNQEVAAQAAKRDRQNQEDRQATADAVAAAVNAGFGANLPMSGNSGAATASGAPKASTAATPPPSGAPASAPDPSCSGKNQRWCAPDSCNHHHGYCGTACDACPD